MVSLSGSTSETVWISPIPRAMRALLALLPCKGLPRWRGAGRRHGARGLAGFETRGVEGPPAEVQHAANGAARACHQRFVLRTTSSRRAPARARRPACARLRTGASLTGRPSARVWREVKRRPGFLLPPSGGRLKGGGNRLSHVAPCVGSAATSSPIASSLPVSQIDVEVDVDRAAHHAVDGVVVRR
jgi:hypothetical protein